MLRYVARRLLQAVLVLFASSFLVYVLAAYAGDPLEDLRTSRDPNRDVLMAQRTAMLNLDTPPVLRYFLWLRGASGCLVPGMRCDLGVNLAGYQVTDLLARAMAQTILLVTVATILSIIVGISLGIVSALRQYSPLDYGVTFLAFLFFSLPVFWVAVLLKEFGAIRFNDFLRTPTFSPAVIVTVGLLVGVLAYVTAYGALKTRLMIAVGLGGLVAVIMAVVSATGWIARPFLGIPGIVVLGLLAALVFTFLGAGFRNRRALYAGFASVAVAAIIYFPIQPLLEQATWLMMLGLGLLTLAVGAGIGYAFGGYDRGQGARVAMMTSLICAGLIVADRLMQSWPAYVSHGRIRGRPISTVGSSTPGFNEGFWMTNIDTFTHLILPTIALMLIALAGYSRYSRASMLEIMNQDYIRTARAKGVSERSVVMKHAFRNALIPLATLIAFDIGGLIGGAVVTENVFAITGMGQLFISSLRLVDLNPIMGFFLVTGLLAMVFNLVADLLYAVLDPRVRVSA
ncbi:peptide/nickel transport system permease protein [Kineosphaera limosa]|uniref:Putative ABC transporter permease protein n=1 Tax=Kineosphaera limosa NBRC 100340 TaxID=1184609 RepID=K6WZW3_9MICO|nr:ABC transporter permease [Kineosphaera limosa]NYE00232.1 peptide/nickel transport system permease protein [Kineosphaera limosa]GAB97657.1 putative ABC transporter permease protein [Kineosphaera limosa NBRC 100340]